MRYLRGLLYNIFTVFFANYLIPGIEMMSHTKIPDIGGDVTFAAGLGFLNFLVGVIFKVFSLYPSILRLSVIAFVLNFASYALLKILPLGVSFTSIEGYVIASVVVSIGSTLFNALMLKGNHGKVLHREPHLEEEFHGSHEHFNHEDIDDSEI